MFLREGAVGFMSGFNERKLERAFEDKDEEELKRILNVLKELRDGEQIRNSRLGVIINKARKADWVEKGVKDEATLLLKGWAEILRGTKEALTKRKDEEVESTEKRIKLSDEIREKCVQMLIEALLVENKSENGLVEEIARQVEEALYDAGNKKTGAEYRAAVRTKFLNLKRNAALRSGLLCGTLAPITFASMTATEMASEEQRQRDLALQRQNLLNAHSAVDNQAETDQFRCGKCKQRKCKYYQLQTRSADEPMTTFVTCLNCNHRWKFC